MSLIVTWITPHTRCERALERAGEHLEFKRYAQARAELNAAEGHLSDLQAQLDREEAAASELARLQAECHQKGCG